MPPLRLLGFVVCFLFFFVCLLQLVYSTRNDYQDADNEYGVLRHALELPDVRPFFSFNSPSVLFAPAATISLTDDNSMFFAARSAAFGPSLPESGLSGPLWIGAGFQDGPLIGTEGLRLAAEGELGCDDLPDWQEREPILKRRTSTALKTLQDWQDRDNIHGRVVLLSRGACGFGEKVKWAQRRGATAVIVGDSAPGGLLVRMWAKDSSNITIPSVFTSHITAHLLSSLVPLDSNSGVGPGLPSRPDIEPSPTKASLPRKGQYASLVPDGRPHKSPGQPFSSIHGGLWVTLTVSNMTISPFFNTLFILVVSPLLTLAVVYILLYLRSRIRRRRWRAPKSLVDRLPVRIYHTSSSRPSPVVVATCPPDAATSPSVSIDQRVTEALIRSDDSGIVSETPRAAATTQYGSIGSTRTVQEKTLQSASTRPHRYNGRQVECSVCLEEYEDGVSKVMSLPCGHDFHVDCITPWLTTKRRTCPICKGDVVRSMSDMEEAGYQDSGLAARALLSASSSHDDHESSEQTHDHYSSANFSRPSSDD